MFPLPQFITAAVNAVRGAAVSVHGPTAPDTGKYNVQRVYDLAGRMNPQQKVQWASKSTRIVEPRLLDADLKAVAAAEEWLSSPTAETAAKAGEQARQAGHSGPGSWAAQAAKWSSEHVGQTEGLAPGPASTAAESVASSGHASFTRGLGPTPLELATSATVGAVLLAAGIAADGSSGGDDSGGDVAAAARDEAESGAAGAGPTEGGEPDPAQADQEALALQPFIDEGEAILNQTPPT